MQPVVRMCVVAAIDVTQIGATPHHYEDRLHEWYEQYDHCALNVSRFGEMNVLEAISDCDATCREGVAELPPAVGHYGRS